MSLVSLSLVAAACGDDEDSAPTTQAPAATSPASSAPAGSPATPATTAPAETDPESTEVMSTETPTTDTHSMDTMDTTDSMDSTDSTDGTDTTDASGGSGGSGESAGGVESPASELRAGLTSLLQEHVYLAGIAIGTAVQAGGDMEAPAVTSAVETLDANSVALADAVTSVYGEAGGEQFLQLWRDHIGFFVEYTLGGATGNTEQQTAAKEKLDNYRADFGAFLESATEGNLDATTVAENLQVHVNTLVEAVDAILAGENDVYTKLQAAAAHMPSTATALSGAIVAQNEEQFAGDVMSPASELRSGLTYLLQEHAYLAGIAINQAVADGGDLQAPLTANAVETLDANSVALSEAITSVYGEAGGEQFLQLWRDHIGFFVEYTLGGATGNAEQQTAAKEKLDNYRADFGAFLESATEGNISADAVAEALQVHVDTLIEAIDAILAGSPEVHPELREAASHMPPTALALASAIAAQFPDQFGS